MSETCKAITASGHACDMLPMDNEEYCQWHHPDPDKRAKKKYAIKDEAIIFDRPIISLNAIFELLGVCLQQTAALKFNPKTLSAIQNACGTQAKIMETMVFAKKLKRLEQMVKGDIRYQMFSEDIG